MNEISETFQGIRENFEKLYQKILINARRTRKEVKKREILKSEVKVHEDYCWWKIEEKRQKGNSNSEKYRLSFWGDKLKDALLKSKIFKISTKIRNEKMKSHTTISTRLYSSVAFSIFERALQLTYLIHSRIDFFIGIFENF